MHEDLIRRLRNGSAPLAEWLDQGGYFDIEHHAALRALDQALGTR